MSRKSDPRINLPAARWPHGSVACDSCGSVSILHPVRCPVCGGTDMRSVDLEGIGAVEAITTVTERLTPPEEGVLSVALVRLAQGPLVLARASADVVIGAEVQLELVQTAKGDFVPHVLSASG